MKRSTQLMLASAIALGILRFCGTVCAQDKNREKFLGITAQPSSAGLTGAGTGRVDATPAKPGKADGLGNPKLGGERRPLYRLNRSDVITVSFILSPEYDQILTVQPDGFVLLRDAGQVSALGLTMEEFRLAVSVAYKGYLHDPQITVALKEFEHPYFVAGGELGRPGKYELRTQTSILQAIEIAGGFTHQAKHSQVVLFRQMDGDLVEARLFNIKQMLKEKEISEVPILQPGDLLFVPQNSISKIERFLTKPSMGMYVSSSQF